MYVMPIHLDISVSKRGQVRVKIHVQAKRVHFLGLPEIERPRWPATRRTLYVRPPTEFWICKCGVHDTWQEHYAVVTEQV